MRIAASEGEGPVARVTGPTRGPVWLIAQGQVDPQPFVVPSTAPAAAFQADNSEKGLRSFAFHPDFENAGSPGFGMFYTISTESVASAQAGVPVFNRPFAPVHHDVVAEWQVSATDPTRIDVASRWEIVLVPSVRRACGRRSGSHR